MQSNRKWEAKSSNIRQEQQYIIITQHTRQKLRHLSVDTLQYRADISGGLENSNVTDEKSYGKEVNGGKVTR